MLFNGKTIEEALITAEKETGKKREEFVYKVNEKKSGLFKSKEYEIEITSFKKNGMLEIKNGKVIYHSGDIKPSLTPGENMVVRVNGKVVTTKTWIKEEDEIGVEVLNTDSGRSAFIEVSEDKLIAHMEIKYLSERAFEIIDKEPGQDIVVEAKCTRSIMPELYSRKDIEELLAANNIKYGIQWQNINQMINGGKHVIAEGLAPIPPENDKLNYFFNNGNEKKPIEINGKVDYYSIGKIDTVESGAILALREPGRDGKAGCSVFGATIPPEKKETLRIKKGPGVDLLDDGNRAIALVKGMVSIKNGSLCVFPVHNVNGDVDIKTGNIEFDGDIVVTGDIKEGLKVSSGNNLTVYGNAAEAVIISGGNIRIDKNVISCSIKAGEKQINDLKAFEYIKAFTGFLSNAVNTYGELKKSGKLSENISLSTFFKVFLESKSKNHRDKIYEGKDFLSKNKINEDMANLWQDGIKFLRRLDEGELTDIRIAIRLNHFLNEFIEKYEITAAPADITLNYCQNANILATNNVEIKGKGCYNTNISANNKIIFTGYPGVMRGGQLFGANGIVAKEIGSSAGVVTVLKTLKESTIEASVAFQNTIIIVGEQVHRIDVPVKNLKAYIEKGEIVVEKLKL